MFPANHSGGQAPSRPPYQAPYSRTLQVTSDNDGTAEESFRLVKRFFLNQSVDVNIEGRGWLVGTVVLLAKTVQSLTGSSVRVRYSIPTEQNERVGEFPNHPDHIRPRQDGQKLSA